LARQVKDAGIDLRLARPLGEQQVFDKPPVTIDIDQQPFWVALQALSPHFGLYQMGRADKSMLTLRAKTGDENAENRDNMAGPSVVSGPCLVIAQRIDRSQTISLRLNRPQPAQKSERMNVEFTVFVDPKLRVRRNASKLKLEQATDEQGNSLLPPGMMGRFNDVGSYFGAFQAASPLNLSAQLTPGPGTRITKLKGTLRLSVETKKEVWEVPDILQARDIAKTITKPGGNERYLVQEVKQRGQNYEVHVIVSRAGRDDRDERGEGRINHNIFSSLRLVDAQGRELQPSGSSTRGGNNELTGNISFTRPQGGNAGDVGEPVKLVWDIPTESKAIEVPFEFTDLPLP
ncbi:MAG TPA: hypothetical protein VNA16_00740, partial [Abditibacteriaceae bacterium]|nr:hypothetical protein [Abditibacteriaceae bacterium]